MRRFVTAFAVLSLTAALGAQDQPEPPLPAEVVQQVEELVEQLGDDDPVVRDQAQSKLIKLGPRIVTALKQVAAASKDPQIRDSVLTIAQNIEAQEKLSKVYREARRANLKLEGANAKSAFDHIEKAYGIALHPLARLPEGVVTVDLKDATILQAMDAVCAQLKSVAYDFDAEKIRLTSGPFVPQPRAYAEAFRVRVVSLTKTVENTFDKLTAQMAVKLAADWGPEVKPLEGYMIDVQEAVGAGGEKLTVTNPYGPNAMNPMWQIQKMRGGVGPETLVNVTELPPSLTKLSSIKCKATFRFPLDNRVVRIENPTNSSEQKVGDYTITVQNVSSNYVIMNITCSSDVAASGLGDTVDFDSFEVIDKENNKEKAQVHPTGGGNRNFQFYVMIQGGGRRKGISQIVFNLREVKAMSFDFELKDIEIPR